MTRKEIIRKVLDTVLWTRNASDDNKEVLTNILVKALEPTTKNDLPCGEKMEFPDTFEEFVEQYGFIDSEEIYTNASWLIPVFRVKQLLEYISTTKNDLGVSSGLKNGSLIIDWNNCHTSEQLDSIATTKNDLGVDCIDRAEVLKLMQDNWHTHNGDWAMQESMDDIRALPSVTPQEPRIITCKDCKYYRNKGNKRSYCTKRLNVDSVTDRYREPNFYCADAVLREVEKRQEKKQ